MKKFILLAALAAGLVAPVMAEDTNVLSDEKARVSYALGLSASTSWKKNGLDIDNNIFVRALNDASSGGPTLMTEAEMNQTLKAYSKTLQAKRQAKMMEAGIKNKSEGLAFLATNKNNPGVITLTNGLQYQVLKDGNGPIPTATSTVTVIYRGTFIDGTEFDSSAKEGKPNGMDMQVTRVIPGWTQALEMMKTGSKWRLFVPSDLAYGPRGQRDIEPNKTLIFDIELLAVQAPHPAPIAPPQNAPLTSDIIKVPSADELKKGAKIEVIKPEDVQKAQAQAQGQTNAPPQ